jgi:hypothetical protein
MVHRSILVRFNNDATACFDRILVHVLRATGGALNLDKCFTQVLEYTFAINGGPAVAPANPDIRIVIQDRLLKQDVVLKPISPFQTYIFWERNRESARINVISIGSL